MEITTDWAMLGGFYFCVVAGFALGFLFSSMLWARGEDIDPEENLGDECLVHVDFSKKAYQEGVKHESASHH